MKKVIFRSVPFVIIFLVIAVLLAVFFFKSRPLSDAARGKSPSAAGNGANGKEQGKNPSATGIGTIVIKNDDAARAVLSFSNEFKTIEKSSVDEDIEFFLWEAAMSEDSNDAEAAAQTAKFSIQQLAEKFKQLAASEGVHYIERSNAPGMTMETEYWVKNGKFKMFEKALNQVTLYGGKYYYVIKLDEKTAQRTSTDNTFVSVDVDAKVNGTLSKLANAGYSQEPDQKVGDFDCSVFYLDIEALGMKGNRMYVDKKTGMLVKSVYGDEKNGMTAEITEFQKGGFGDEVFAVPPGITIE